MFVQVVQGRISDASRVREQMEKWQRDLAPGAQGWLGSTGGVTEDGRLIALVRFESEELAMQNSDRPEQGAWWSEMSQLFTEEPVFHNSTSAEADTPGDPQQAGFVQVMQGRTNDPERSRELMDNDSIDWQSIRPEILGTLSVGHDGDGWTMAIYFTNEAEAREGEAKPPTPEMEQMMKEMQALSVGEPTYFDLKDPWLNAPS